MDGMEATPERINLLLNICRIMNDDKLIKKVMITPLKNPFRDELQQRKASGRR